MNQNKNEELIKFGLELEKYLKDVDGVKDAAVFADRIVGKPYLLLEIDRDAISRHGLSNCKQRDATGINQPRVFLKSLFIQFWCNATFP